MRPSSGRWGSNRTWSWPSPACISCAGRCSTGSRGFRRRSGRPWRSCSGLTAGEAPDRFLVGLAVLSLFSEVAEQRPLLCVVDDAQWLDQASALTLAFVARRLLAEPVAIVFAAREPGEELLHVSELEVDGVRNGDARALLSSAVRFKLDERVRDRIIAETRGNPLALLELPRGLTARQLAGGFGLVEAQGLAGRIEESFVRRVETLSDDARRLLLVAAAEPVGDPLLLLAASERLGIAVSAVDAETDGLLAFGERVTFRHPLVRSAVYRTATREQRREVHLALAEATDRSVDPDRRAWHLATAAAGPRRAGRRGARAVRRPRAGARRPGRGSGVPASLCRSVGRSQAAGAACACRCPSELACRHLSRAGSSFWRWSRPRRQTSCSRRRWSCSAARSRSRRAWEAQRRHCS